jgi:hypothetical protein
MRLKHSFHEYVRNPDLFRQEVTDWDAASAALPVSPVELVSLVGELTRRRLEWDELAGLRSAGGTAVPLLLAALRDGAVQVHRYGPSVLDGSPLETALELLEPFAVPEADALSPALHCPDDAIKQQALLHLAKCGRDDAIPALTDALDSGSEGCRTWAMMGLEFLAKSGRGSAEFREALFRAVVPRLADREYGPAEHAPRALLALDRQRAAEVLLSDHWFRAENPKSYELLEALAGAKVPVPGRPLRRLLEGLKPKADGFPFDRAYALGLCLLAATEGEGANDLIDDAIAWGNDHVRTGAAEACLRVAGVVDAHGVAYARYRDGGVAALTPPQLHFLAIQWLDWEVCNGGFTQFYFNSSGELARSAEQAARVVGCDEVAEIVREANALFGPGGPAADRSERADQLSRIDLERLSPMDSRYYRQDKRVRELLLLYVARNAEHFRPTEPG